MATAASVISCMSRTSDIGCRPAKPGCGARTTLDDYIYIDGCGQVCPGCDPVPPWWGDLDGIEPPF